VQCFFGNKDIAMGLTLLDVEAVLWAALGIASQWVGGDVGTSLRTAFALAA